MYNTNREGRALNKQAGVNEEIPTVGSPEWEAAVTDCCALAGLTRTQQELVLLLAEGYPERKARIALGLENHSHRWRCLWEQVRTKLVHCYPALAEHGRDYARHLLAASGAEAGLLTWEAMTEADFTADVQAAGVLPRNAEPLRLRRVERLSWPAVARALQCSVPVAQCRVADGEAQIRAHREQESVREDARRESNAQALYQMYRGPAMSSPPTPVFAENRYDGTIREVRLRTPLVTAANFHG